MASVLETKTGIFRNRLINHVVETLAVGLLSLLTLILLFRMRAKSISSEIAILQKGISLRDPTTLLHRFTIREFREIAANATDTFSEINSAHEKFDKAFKKNVAMMSISLLKDGRITEVNDAFLNTLHFTASEVIGHTSAELGFIDPALRKSIVEKIPTTGDTGTIEVQYPDKLGNTHFGEFRAQVVELEGEQCLLSVIHDTTDRKRIEGQLVQLSRAIEQSPVSVVITDLKGTIEYVNPKFCALTGYSKEEAIGQNPRILKSGDIPPETYKAMWQAIVGGQEWRCEFHNKRKDGTHFWETAFISGIRDKDGTISHFLAVKEDITEKRALETQLRQAQKLESVGQLAAGIAHEINTPIQFVGDNLIFLQDSAKDLLETTERYASLIVEIKQSEIDPLIVQKHAGILSEMDLEYLRNEVPKAISESIEGVNRVAKIVRSMKEFSHPGSTEKSLANLNEAIETTITIARNEWKYVAEVRTDFAEDLPLVPCLVGEFNQVILNMIVNACDAITETAKNGLITIATAHTEDWVIIRISDTGAGMPIGIQERIFDPFFTTKEVGKGSGQGLAIAHNVIVKKHDGEITVSSVPQRGDDLRDPPAASSERP